MARDNEPVSTLNSTSHSPFIVPRLLRVQPTQQVTSESARADDQTNLTSVTTAVKSMARQKATALAGHLTRLRHRDRAPAHGVTADREPDPAEWSSQTLQVPYNTPMDPHNTNAESFGGGDPEQPSSDPMLPTTYTKRFQDMISTIPSFVSSISSAPSQATPPPQIQIEPDGSNSPTGVASGSSRPVEPASSQINASDPPSPGRHPFVTLPSFGNSPLEHGFQTLRSTLDRLRPPFGKRPETAGASEPSQDEVLDCLDDNNSVMMYGPLEPDAMSEVEIACSEIVSLNGDGEEVRTPQPRFSPLPSEAGDDVLMGTGGRSPPPRNIPLPLESINQILLARSPRPRFTPLPMGSIDQVLMGGDGNGELPGAQGGEDGSVLASGATGTTLALPPVESTADQPPVKEYRVWLPSLTKLSVQTMWWGFRIYLPPPVLDVLNNKQLEAAKRAAIITTALQWLMEHLPISLLPPQMHPGVAILRYLVPYVGYMGAFIAWGWSAIRSFDKGYGVVLTATWLLPFLLIPGTWEANEVPSLNTDTQQSTAVTS